MKESLNSAYLLIGGNIGNREAALQSACAAIETSCGRIVQKSALYETAAWGGIAQAAFLNQALLVKTPLPAEDLLLCLLNMEERLGRLRTEKYGPRMIDIDILFFNEAQINLPHLQVPHPQIAARRFVLEPLAEIAPYLLHPLLQLSVKQLLEQCADPLPVHKISEL